MTDGRKKGKVAELEVVELVQTWWQQLEPDAKFRRTPSSGAWGSGDNGEGFNAAADIMTTSKLFPFSIEIKRREGWSLQRFKEGKRSPVKTWWVQARNEARTNAQIPMLWVRKSRMPWLVLLPEAFVFACWRHEREQLTKASHAIGLPNANGASILPVPLRGLWGDVMVFEADHLLMYPPRFFILKTA